MNVEIVTADQIRPGDRITWRRAIYTVKSIVDQEAYLDIIYVSDNPEEEAINYAIPVWRDELISRILPEPLEVREFWRAVHEDLDGERFGEECETREDAIDDGANLRVDQFEIEHVRETILSREEVQS